MSDAAVMEPRVDRWCGSAWAERPPQIDVDLFRQVLGRFASGVVVVTTRVDQHVHGMTASAFMSGSLRPPLIVVSVARTARFHELLRRTGGFGVSILEAKQEAYSRHFSGQSQQSLEPSFRWYVADIPVLSDAFASISARVQAEHDCGDHTLFVGRICHLALHADGQPLVYFSGKYRALS